VSSALDFWEWTRVPAQSLPHTDGRNHGGAETVDRNWLHSLEYDPSFVDSEGWWRGVV
jgi:hypothetical protein